MAPDANPKFKDGRDMSQEGWSLEDQKVVENLAKKWEIDLEADDVAGPNATFASIEMAARRVGQAVTRQICEDLAAKQANLAKEPQPCPTCEKLCEVDFRERAMTTGDGPIGLVEVVCHCSACRRDFFPSASAIGSSSARL
jgi:hypothetical protein